MVHHERRLTLSINTMRILHVFLILCLLVLVTCRPSTIRPNDVSDNSQPSSKGADNNNFEAEKETFSEVNGGGVEHKRHLFGEAAVKRGKEESGNSKFTEGPDTSKDGSTPGNSFPKRTNKHLVDTATSLPKKFNETLTFSKERKHVLKEKGSSGGSSKEKALINVLAGKEQNPSDTSSVVYFSNSSHKPTDRKSASDSVHSPNVPTTDRASENLIIRDSLKDQRQTDLSNRNSDHWELTNDDESVPEDDCEINQLRCSPFFGSRCEKLNPDRGSPYGGHCPVSRHAAEKTWVPCGGQRTPHNSSACFCSNHSAVCCANLTAIPDFSVDYKKTILYLNFTSNNLTVLDKHVLENVTHLKWLILSRNNLSTVFNDSLDNLKYLERFELAYNRFDNKLNPQNLTEAVNRVHTLRVLDLNYTEFDEAKRTEVGITWLIRNLRLPNLTQLFVDGGRKTRFYLSDVDRSRLPKLCKFSLASHLVQNIYCCSTRSFDLLHYGNEEEEDDDSSEDTLSFDETIEEFSCISRKSQNHSHCKEFQLPNMKLLNFDNNSLVYVPHFCKPVNRTVVPNLTHLLLATNAIINPKQYQFLCLNNLIFLGLTGNPLKMIQQNLFQYLGQLQAVDMRFTNVMQIDPYAFNHSSLRSVTIKSSNWFVDQHHEACCISPHLFRGTALEAVDLSYNVFSYATKNTTNTFLSPLRTVKKLLIMDVGLDYIPAVVQREFTSLEHLNFRGNLLHQVPERAFDKLHHLKYLDLSNNYIATPREGVLWKLVVHRHVHVNLASNPFSCTCDLLPFLLLYMAHREPPHNDTTTTTRLLLPPPPPSPHHPILLTSLPNNGSDQIGLLVGGWYRCAAPDSLSNVSLERVPLSEHNCLLTFRQEFFILVLSLLFIFCLLIYALLYKYRWQVRFWLYVMHVRLNRAHRRPPSGAGGGGGGRGTRGHPPRGQPVCRPRFKAFVSYCKEDSHFVINKVLPALERNSRLPLCIHERDFIPGRYISQNVVECMEESRHVLLVLSNAFLRSDWCRFELFVAQKYGLVHRRIPLHVLLLERLQEDLVDAHVVTLLQAAPGIVWPGEEGDPRDRASFWTSLGQTLGSSAPAPPAVRRGGGAGAGVGRV